MLRHIEVVAVISNPVPYKSRYELYRKFAEALKKQEGVEARLWTIELQHGSRPMQVTHVEHENHVQLYTSGLHGLLWHKENLQNLALAYIIQNVPSVRKLAFVDADFLFEPDAFAKTYDALDHYDGVQMYSHLVNLGPDGGIVGGISNSFMYCYAHGITRQNNAKYIGGCGCPGGAWAFRRDSLGKLGSALSSPFIDWNIVGGGDRAMAMGLVGQIENQIDPGYSEGYTQSMYRWQQNALAGLHKNIGYVETTIRHMWHGRVVDRGYDSRWKILIDYKFDPFTDLKRDLNGLWHLVVQSERQIKIRDALRKYFFSRKEDATTAS